ncbi:MAG: FAD-binding monooxygenase [Micromonosporaceae bacterium]|nr:FAD-binding monooxygenase [Micromonosporaceae bacterium]
MSNTHREHAIVLGGSVCGLLVARVLAEHYRRVLVVERDRLPAGIQQRRAVPQGHHVHGLLPRGLAVAEGLLPGLTDQLVADGARLGDLVGNVRWYLGGRRLPRSPAGLPTVVGSRPLIEHGIRARVRALPSVTLLDGHDIVGLAATPDRARITGVQVSNVYSNQAWTIPADLVVDATGRGSRAPRWLTELGYQAPPRDEMHMEVAYASRIFAAPPGILGTDLVAVTTRLPGQRRSSVLSLLEGERLLVSLAGVRGERPPLELDAFTGYAKSLAAPDTYEVIRASRPLSAPVAFRLPTYLRHRYERLPASPAGLLVAGDAACNFNPVFAQGMSVAALGAMAVDEQLRHGGEPEPARYFRALAAILDAPWGIGVRGDLTAPGAVAPALPPSPLTGEYMHRLQSAAAQDEVLARSLVRVLALVDPPEALVRPEILARVPEPAQL